jgi:hypothetical protein
MMNRLVLLGLSILLLTACNNNKDDSVQNVLVANPLSDLLPTTEVSLEMPPTDGKLPTDLFPPQ